MAVRTVTFDLSNLSPTFSASTASTASADDLEKAVTQTQTAWIFRTGIGLATRTAAPAPGTTAAKATEGTAAVAAATKIPPPQTPCGTLNEYGLRHDETKRILPWWANALLFVAPLDGAIAALYMAIQQLTLGSSAHGEKQMATLSITSSAVTIAACLACIAVLSASKLGCIMKKPFRLALFACFLMSVFWGISLIGTMNNSKSVSGYISSPLGQALPANIAASVVYLVVLVWSNPTRFTSRGAASTEELRAEDDDKFNRGDGGDVALRALPEDYGRGSFRPGPPGKGSR